MQVYKQKSGFSASKNKMAKKMLGVKYSCDELNPIKRKIVICEYNLE